jgi:hypothetical protein
MGFVKNIVFDNIHIRDPVVYAIDIIMSSDHLSSGQQRQPEMQHPQTVDLQAVTIRNVTGVLGAVPPPS